MIKMRVIDQTHDEHTQRDRFEIRADQPVLIIVERDQDSFICFVFSEGDTTDLVGWYNSLDVARDWQVPESK